MVTAHFPAFQSVRLLVCGDIMLDRYWYGTTSRISPEAPVPVVLVNDTELRPGGAANVALNLVALDVKTTLLGLIGQDLEGKELQNILEENAVCCHFQKLADHRTIVKLRLLSGHQQLIRMDFEPDFSQVDHSDLIQCYEKQLDQVDAVLLSDYAKGSLHHVESLISLACNRGLPILVDPKSDDFSRYIGATLVTPNRREFERVVGCCESIEDIENKAVDLLQRLDIKALLITLGKDGLLLVLQEGVSYYFPTHAHAVYDVTGAGDTVIAVLSAAIAAGQPVEQAAQLANVAAGIVVGKLGTATVSIAELQRAVQEEQSHPRTGILTQDLLLSMVAKARKQGQKIVMTNGCFDVLHTGHVHYLEQAKSLGDRLIVAINDDDSVRRLKGAKRPFNTLEDRMNVVASLRAVDWVVFFSEETPECLIKAVKPDVLVKGGDYRSDEIAGSDQVIAYGGEVKVLDWIPGASSTKLIEKMQETSEQII